MFCPHCGTKNEAEARFCGSCGGDLGKPKAPSGPETRPDPVEPVRIIDPEQAPGLVAPGLKWGVLGASLLMPLIGIGMGLYYWIRAESEDKIAVGKLWFFVALGIVVLYSLLSEV